MSATVLQCPMFNICRASMARVCTCELLANHLGSKAVLLNPRVYLKGGVASVQMKLERHEP